MRHILIKLSKLFTNNQQKLKSQPYRFLSVKLQDSQKKHTTFSQTLLSVYLFYQIFSSSVRRYRFHHIYQSQTLDCFIYYKKWKIFSWRNKSLILHFTIFHWHRHFSGKVNIFPVAFLWINYSKLWAGKMRVHFTEKKKFKDTAMKQIYKNTLVSLTKFCIAYEPSSEHKRIF